MSKQVIERGVKVPMRDGVNLAADIYRPDDNEKHPVLIETIMMSRNNARSVSKMPPVNHPTGHSFQICSVSPASKPITPQTKPRAAATRPIVVRLDPTDMAHLPVFDHATNALLALHTVFARGGKPGGETPWLQVIW